MLAGTTNTNTDTLCDDDDRDPRERGKSSRSRSRRLSRSLSTENQEVYDDAISVGAEKVDNVDAKSSDEKAKPRRSSSRRGSKNSRSTKPVMDGISRSPTRRMKSHSVKSSNGQWTEGREIPTLDSLCH